MEKIIERVQKLLALAGNNSNENEAAAAIAKAHAILAEHNLSMQAVQDHDASTGNAEDEERGALNTETNFSEKYYSWLWGAVAKAHYCTYFKCRPDPRKRATTYTVVGRRVNALVASQLAMYLCQTVRRLANEEAKRHGRDDHGFKNAFIAGACHRLYERVVALKHEDAKAQGALVVWTGQEEEKNNEFVAKVMGLNLTLAKTRPVRVDPRGLAAGRKAGDSISLAQQVGAGPAAKQVEGGR